MSLTPNLQSRTIIKGGKSINWGIFSGGLGSVKSGPSWEWSTRLPNDQTVQTSDSTARPASSFASHVSLRPTLPGTRFYLYNVHEGQRPGSEFRLVFLVWLPFSTFRAFPRPRPTGSIRHLIFARIAPPEEVRRVIATWSSGPPIIITIESPYRRQILSMLSNYYFVLSDDTYDYRQVKRLE